MSLAASQPYDVVLLDISLPDATVLETVAALKRRAPELPILIPGVGAQQGDLAAAVRAGVDRAGELAIVSASRQVLYASPGADWAAAAQASRPRCRHT